MLPISAGLKNVFEVDPVPSIPVPCILPPSKSISKNMVNENKLPEQSLHPTIVSFSLDSKTNVAVLQGINVSACVVFVEDSGLS